jgi:hypothetical protein
MQRVFKDQLGNDDVHACCPCQHANAGGHTPAIILDCLLPLVHSARLFPSLRFLCLLPAIWRAAPHDRTALLPATWHGVLYGVHVRECCIPSHVAAPQQVPRIAVEQ